MDKPLRKVSFIVDGFNLYFSLREMEGLSKKPSRWLDLRRMCESFVQAIGQHLGVRTELGGIHYFSAYATHATVRDKGIVDRLAVKLLEVFALSEAPIGVLMTGDSDLVPAVHTARRLFPENTIGIITPFLRHTTEMQEIGDFHFKVSQKLVQSAQFPNPVRLPDGRVIAKPHGW